jgi:hypothetical protein
MKRSDESPNAGCEETELLLIKKTIEELTGDESLLVGEHLKSCQRCRSLETAVVSMQDTMRTSTEAAPVPDPAVRQNVLRQMNALKLKQPGIFSRGWQYVKDVFEYRIPVYQTLLGAALVVLLFFAVRQLSITSPQPPSEPQSAAQMETPMIGQMSVLDDLGILDRQKIGRNAKEDGYLSRFIVSTM